MNSTNFNVVLTGAAGNIASILIFMLAESNIFGEDKRINLRLIDLPQFRQKLIGLSLELEDCLFPRLNSVNVLHESKESFQDADCVILVAGKPRSLGMERRDLLESNALLFKRQAELCVGVIKPSTKILVVANPCNTNALVFSHYLPSLDTSNITALSWLDKNRATNFIARKLHSHFSQVKNVTIFGNHSNTMLVDISKAYLTACLNDKLDNLYIPFDSKSDARKVMLSELLPGEYCRNEIQSLIRLRGGAIIQFKGTSSGYSAAKSIIDHLQAWFLGTSEEICSMAVIVDGILGSDERLCISLPVICNKGSIKVIENLTEGVDSEFAARMQESVDELVIEKLTAIQYCGYRNN
jgi:malate dehydrogenase